jgi:hypothetical protein
MQSQRGEKETTREEKRREEKRRCIKQATCAPAPLFSSEVMRP